MSFTYTPGTDIGRIRMQLQDVVAERAAFSDEEIEDAITTEGSVRAATAMLARALLMRGTRTARNYSSPEGSVDEVGALAYLQDLVVRLEAQGSTSTPSSTLPLVEVTDMARAPNDPYYAIGGG